MAVTIPIHLLKSSSIDFIKKGRTVVRPFFMHITVVIYVDLITHPLLL